MKDILTVGLLAIGAALIFKKSVPPTIILPKAIVQVNKIR